MTIFGRFKSIRDAMMLSFSVLVVVAVLIFLLIAMNFTKKTIYENSRTSTSQLISQVNYDIDSYIDYMENISWVAASGSDLSRYLFNQEQTPEEKEAAKERILTQFTTILESRSDIYNVAALNGVSVKIEQGEFVFIVGDSGSGKSTLIKLIMKELDPTSGTIIVNGQNLNRMKHRHIPKYRRGLGVVFQDFRLLLYITLLDTAICSAGL